MISILNQIVSFPLRKQVKDAITGDKNVIEYATAIIIDKNQRFSSNSGNTYIEYQLIFRKWYYT